MVDPDNRGPRRRITDGVITCSTCSNKTRVSGGIWLAMGDRSPQRTLAQLSNVVPPTPQLYERLWRHRSLSILSSGQTSTAEELQELVGVFRSSFDRTDNETGAHGPDNHLSTVDRTDNETGAHGFEKNRSGESSSRVIVDIACSEGLYARTLATEFGATVIAVDHSLAFLKRLIHRSGALPIIAIQALAQNLPIASGSVDGVVIGGSLNEIGDQAHAVAEMGRIAATGSTMFSMSLTPAATRFGRTVQKLARLGGVVFPTVDATTQLFAAAGFAVEPPQTDGVVLRLHGTRR